MKIFEFLVLEQSSNLMDKIVSPLPFMTENIQNLSVYRLEVSPDLVILLYRPVENLNQMKNWFEGVYPHLHGALILLEGDDALNVFRSELSLMQLDEALSSKPLVLGIRAESHQLKKYDDFLVKNGLYLEEQQRLRFWNEDFPETVNALWESLFVQLQKAQEPLEVDMKGI